MAPKAQHTAESKPGSPVGLFQAIGQFASPRNHHCNFLIVHMWRALWNLILPGHTQWLLFQWSHLPASPFLCSGKAHVASCPGSWMSVEAAVPAKPQNMLERRAVEPGSPPRSAGTGGHSQKGNNHWCETGLRPVKEHVKELCSNKRVCLC